MEQLKEMLFQLCSAAGTPGDEHFAALQAKKALEPYCTDVTIDHMGNVIGFMGDKNAERQVMLDAHIDQIGMIVTQIDEDGFLHIAPCGGVDRRVLPGAPVTVYGHETLTGIVCCLPPHLVEDDGNKVEPVDKMAVDLGLTKEEAAKFFPVGPNTTTLPPVIYSQQWSPTPSTTAVAPEFLTAKRSPARPAI